MYLEYVAADGDSIELAGGPVRLLALEGAGVAEPRDQIERVPRRDGVTIVRDELEERYIRATVRAAGSTWAGLHALRRELASVLNPRRGLGVLRYQPVDGGPTYEIPAKYAGGAGFGGGGQQGFRDQFSVSFRCPDPGWRQTPQQAISLDFALGGLAFPISFPIAFTATGTTQAINNAGDLPSAPVITFTASAGGAEDPAFRNVTTGQEFVLAGLVLAEDESVVVDMDRRTARLNDGTNVMALRTPASEMWTLVPGINEVAVSASVGSGAVVLEYWRRLVGV